MGPYDCPTNGPGYWAPEHAECTCDRHSAGDEENDCDYCGRKRCEECKRWHNKTDVVHLFACTDLCAECLAEVAIADDWVGEGLSVDPEACAKAGLWWPTEEVPCAAE